LTVDVFPRIFEVSGAGNDRSQMLTNFSTECSFLARQRITALHLLLLAERINIDLESNPA
jgi:hypothetical protein